MPHACQWGCSEYFQQANFDEEPWPSLLELEGVYGSLGASPGAMALCFGLQDYDRGIGDCSHSFCALKMVYHNSSSDIQLTVFQEATSRLQSALAAQNSGSIAYRPLGYQRITSRIAIFRYSTHDGVSSRESD